MCSENKCADQLHSYCATDLRLCFRICKSRFSHDVAYMMLCVSSKKPPSATHPTLSSGSTTSKLFIFLFIFTTSFNFFQIVKPYGGPRRSSVKTNLYIFLLFKQSGPVTVSNAWMEKFNSMAQGAFEFSDLISDWSLTGIQVFEMCHEKTCFEPYSMRYT